MVLLLSTACAGAQLLPCCLEASVVEHAWKTDPHPASRITVIFQCAAENNIVVGEARVEVQMELAVGEPPLKGSDSLLRANILWVIDLREAPLADNVG